MSLTDRDRKIVIMLLPLILIAVYWFLILSPKRKEAHKLSGQVTKVQQARDAAVSQANTLEQAKANFASQYAEMVRLGKAIPTQVDMPSLIVQLDSAAHGTGIQFGDIKVGARVAAAPVATTSTTPSTGTTQPPVAAGGAPAQTTFGKAAESANNAAATGNAQSIQQSGLSADDASTSTSTKSGGLPVGGGSASSAAAAVTPGQPVPGLDTVPLTFTFGGKFNNLAQFFHRLKRFVHLANNKISVQGRLITIDSLKFTSSAANFPFIEADVSATVYLSPKDGGTTAGATAQGPASTTPGAATSNASAAAAAVTPPTSAITR
jgi:Type II secretion system (T2SS), protein M